MLLLICRGSPFLGGPGPGQPCRRTCGRAAPGVRTPGGRPSGPAAASPTGRPGAYQVGAGPGAALATPQSPGGGGGAALRTTVLDSPSRQGCPKARARHGAHAHPSSLRREPAGMVGRGEAEGAGGAVPERRLDPAWAVGGHAPRAFPRVRRMLGVLRAVLGVLRAALGVLRAVLGVASPPASRPVRGGIVSGPPPALAPPRPPPSPPPPPGRRLPPRPCPPECWVRAPTLQSLGCVLTRRLGPLGGAAVCEQL